MLIRNEHEGVVYYRFATLAGVPGLRHAFFTRLGGVSRPPYATLNLGASVGDDPQAVAENRRRSYAALGYAEDRVVTPFQVHSTTVARVTSAQGGQVLPETDGLIAAEPGLALFLRFADCVPIMLYDARRQGIGLVHAGWRGTLAGIAGVGVRAMCAELGSRPGDLWAGIGPCIGPCCYEVGPELVGQVRERFGPQAEGLLHLGNGSQVHLDLPGANAFLLQQAGVGQVELAGVCTSCHYDEWFSHRREQGRTGRFGAIIGLAPDR